MFVQLILVVVAYRNWTRTDGLLSKRKVVRDSEGGTMENKHAPEIDG